MFEIGGSLREARLKRDLTPADVQKAIRIRDRYLQALEEERWELLPGDAYVKGFLRTYADYLGLDGNLYVEEYNSRFAHPDEPQLVPERFARIERPLRRRRVPATAGRRRRHRRDRRGSRLRGVAAQRLLGRQAGSAADDVDPARRPPRTTRPRRRSTRRTHATMSPSRSRRRAVLVASRGNCWLWVRSGSASGPTVYEGTLAAGQDAAGRPEARPGLDRHRRPVAARRPARRQARARAADPGRQRPADPARAQPLA